MSLGPLETRDDATTRQRKGRLWSRSGARLTSLEDTFTRDGLAFGTEADTSVSGAIGKFENHLGAVLLTKRRARGRGVKGGLAIGGHGDLACSQRRGGHDENRLIWRG